MTKAVSEMDFHENILGTIGDTPLVRLNSIGSDLPCTILVKVEYFNPGNSMIFHPIGGE